MNVVAQALMASVGDESAVVGTRPGPTGLDSRCRSETLALGAVAFCATQAGRWLDVERGPGGGAGKGAGAAGVGGLDVDPARVGASYRSWTHLRLDGAAFSAFDPSSGFFRARDGWVRTHANYDWHRHALRAVLGLDDGAGRQEVGDLDLDRRRAGCEIESGRTDADDHGRTGGQCNGSLDHDPGPRDRRAENRLEATFAVLCSPA